MCPSAAICSPSALIVAAVRCHAAAAANAWTPSRIDR
jgi:hypothetical protein